MSALTARTFGRMRRLSSVPNARASRVVASLVILIQVGIYFVWTYDYLTTTALFVLAWSAALGIRLPGRALLRSRRTYIALGLLIAFKHSASPVELAPLRDYAGTSQVAFEVALFGILTQIGLVFGYVGRRIPYWFPCFTVMSLLFLSDVALRSEQERLRLLAVVTVCVFLCAMLFRLARDPSLARGKPQSLSGWARWPLVLAVLLAGALGSTAAIMLVKYERVVDRFLAGTIGAATSRSGRTAFSGDGQIANVDAWKRAGGDTIALRVFSDYEPGYVPGMKFAYYAGDSWSNGVKGRESIVSPDTENRLTSRPIVPTQVVRFAPNSEGGSNEGRLNESDNIAYIPFPAMGRKLFKLEEVESPSPGSFDSIDVTSFEVWPEKHLPAKVFAPSGAQFVASIDESLSADPLGNITLSKEEIGNRQSVYRIEGFQIVSPYGDVRDAYTKLGGTRDDSELKQVLEATVAELVGDRDIGSLSTELKCSLVEQYFWRNYTYALGTSLGRRNRYRLVAAFLTDERRMGHCEYFASASALLLRVMGVPTRYVTGFVVEEKNEVGEYWVARDRDAHAWVEAWDESSQTWRIVESTPAEGVPQGDANDAQHQLVDALKTMYRRWRASLQERDIQEELTARAAELLSPSTMLTIGCLAALGAVYLSYQQRRALGGNDLAIYHVTLDQVTAALRHRGLQRGDAETLRTFAERVADDGETHWAVDTARWLNEYAALRYRRESDAEGVAALLEQLSETADELVKRIRTKSRYAAVEAEPPIAT